MRFEISGRVALAVFVLASAVLTSAASQSRAPYQFEQFSVTPLPGSGEDGTWLRVDWTGGRAQQFLVRDVFNVFGISHHRNQTLVLESRHTITLVDLRSEEVVDKFSRLRDKQSPAGRYIALQRHSPNGAPFYDSVYSVYDLERSPAANRPRGAGSFNAGQLVYPMANVVAQSYYVSKSERDAHDLQSEFWWLGDSLVAFADYYDGALALVVIDVEAGIDRVRRSVTALDLDAIMKPGERAKALQLRIAKIERADDSGRLALRVTFERQALTAVDHTIVRANALQ
jgi:hypothetical protein